MKKLAILVALAAITLLAAACGGVAGGNLPEAAPPPAASEAYDTQVSDAARVVVDVTPMTLTGDQWDFEVGFNTHSVNLAFDPTQISVLRCDQGQEYPAVAWEGAGPGGHHRSGTLTFAALDHPTSFVEVVIRDVAEVPERVFRWEIPTDAQAPAPDEETATEPADRVATRPPATAIQTRPPGVASPEPTPNATAVQASGAVLAPEFRLPDLEGETWTLSQFQGQPVMLFYWATW